MSSSSKTVHKVDTHSLFNKVNIPGSTVKEDHTESLLANKRTRHLLDNDTHVNVMPIILAIFSFIY